MPDKLNNFTLVLASASPRRAELLRAAGIEFTVRSADIDETQLPNESPHAYVARLSQQKAQAVAQRDEIVLGADTTVVIGDEVAGKPADADDARRMLALLSGQWHDVLTAVAVASWTAGRKNILPGFAPGALTASSLIKTTAARDISIVIAAAALTAGKFSIILEVVQPLV